MAIDARFVTNSLRLANRPVLEAMITTHFAALSSEEVIARLDRAAIANGRMNDVDGLLHHPQVLERKRYRAVQTESGAHDLFLPAVTIPGIEQVMRPVPALGEHTAQILAELGEQSEANDIAQGAQS